jgi:23S rRNA (cytosine1962-C5)-methyltransferase
MQIIVPEFGNDYELIDSGAYRKLERFGEYTLSRPEPQAVWSPAIDPGQWEKMADATFVRNKSAAPAADKGEWTCKKNMPDQWFVSYKKGELQLKMRLGLTSFKHVGIFPEQCDNWDYIFRAVKDHALSRPRVLNLFAYTGGASLAAAAAGAEVVHVDSVKQVINWTKQNMEASGLDAIRWVLEDALKFAAREAKRGNAYQGIILDPPAYGRGPEGEKWQLEENIAQLMEHLNAVLDKTTGSFVVLNLYSMGFSALIANNLLQSYFKASGVEFGELAFSDRAKRKLPLGIYARFKHTP